MNAQRYQTYLAAFNARDYDGVLAFMHPDVELITMGYLIKGHAGIREFYRFFHEHIHEEIRVRSLLADDTRLYAEVVMRLTALRSLDQSVLDAKGLSRFTPVPQGLTVDVDLFLHYELDAGLFRTIKAASYLPHSGSPWRDTEARS
jgi:ketosteroid isomerase-like protein